ncbi:MAG: hypothetical protein ABL893_06460 [Hyphomicrobium sp.]|nr:hypothetical protein [Hyphomicrobium sp.]
MIDFRRVFSLGLIAVLAAVLVNFYAAPTIAEMKKIIPNDLKSVVIEMESVRLLPLIDGSKFGEVSLNTAGVTNPGDVGSYIFVVPVGRSCPVRFFEEYTGFVLTGSGQFILPTEHHSLKEHSFFIKPLAAATQAQIVNTGNIELKILVFRSLSILRFKERTDRAQQIVSAYIERSWKRPTMNWEGYSYDGRLVAMYYRELEYVLVSDEQGFIYFNGQRIRQSDADSVDSAVDKILAAEKALRGNFEKERAEKLKSSAP